MVVTARSRIAGGISTSLHSFDIPPLECTITYEWQTALKGFEEYTHLRFGMLPSLSLHYSMQ